MYINPDIVFICYLIFLGFFLFITFNPNDIYERQIDYIRNEMRRQQWENKYKDISSQTSTSDIEMKNSKEES